MSSAERRPLGSSATVNAAPPRRDPTLAQGVPTIARLDDFKKAVTQVSGQRRHQLAGGDSAKDRQSTSQTSSDVGDLNRQLEKARAKLERRDETIKSLQAQAQAEGQGRPQKADLESKLQDLVQRHQASKSRYQTQLTSLQEDNAKLQSTLASHTKETAALRRKYDLTASENVNLKREMDSLRHAQTHSASVAGMSRKEIKELEDERIKWKAEKHRLEREVTRLQHQLEGAQTVNEKKVHREERAEVELAEKQRDESRMKVRELENEVRRLIAELRVAEETAEANERLESLLEASAEAYRILYKNSVPKRRYDDLEERHLAASMEAGHWEARSERLEAELHDKRVELKDGEDRYTYLKEERDVLAGIVKDLKQDRRLLEEDVRFFTRRQPILESVGTLDSIETIPIIDLALSHNKLATSFLSRRLSEVQDQYIRIAREQEQTSSSLTSSQLTLTAVQRSFASLETRFIALEEAHSGCASTLAEKQTEVTRAHDELDRLSRESEGVKADMSALELRAKNDREALKRANEVVSRSKMAEDALDEEVRHLRDAYDAVAKYEALYLDLEEQHALILAREGAAIDEAERLGLENAELVGHTNEGQKINYVEGVRREMFFVKQELATTRHLLNASQDRVTVLESEVGAYRSVAVGGPVQLGNSGTSRIRVSRQRQPEGGELVQSHLHASRRGPGAGGRSVSGPGHVWRGA